MADTGALKEVLKAALAVSGLARGLREVLREVDRRTAHLVVLANNCDQQDYVKLVEALCASHHIPLLKVGNNKELGEWAGLCKLDREGVVRRTVRCSCVAVTKYGRTDTAAHSLLQDFLHALN